MGKDIALVMQGYREYVALRELADSTRETYRTQIKKLERYCRSQGVHAVSEWDDAFISRYITSVNEQSMSLRTKQRDVMLLKSVIEFCCDEGYILSNPFDRLTVRLQGTHKERVVMSEEEITVFLDIIGCDTWVQIRDKSMFELMYGTGMRVNEVIMLDHDAVDIDHKEVRILHGKGGKQRIVPLCGQALEAMKLWLYQYRSDYAKDACSAVYVNRSGHRLHKQMIEQAMKGYIDKAGLGGKGFVPHSIRHSCATHLLAHGADIRYIQELLGHASIETTAGYTTQERTRLKLIHKQFHPKENELYEEANE